MASEVRRVLSAVVVLVILSCVQAAEIKKADDNRQVVAQPDATSQLIIQLFVGTLVIVGVIILLRELALGLLSALAPPEVPEDPYGTYDTYSYYNRQDYYGPQSYRSLGDNESFISRVLNSIDPVESAFAFMKVEEIACRKRTVCELQKAASKMPIIGALLRYMSPSIGSLVEYKEAQDAGAALEDCALLFSECPFSMLQ